MKYDFGLTFQVDLIVEDSNPEKINDLFVDFLNDLLDVKGYRLVIRQCTSLSSLIEKKVK